MSTLTYLKPAKATSKFLKGDQVKGFKHFPDTFKSYPVLWDHAQHKYIFDGLTDEQVLQYAKKCKLSYEDGEDKGKIINEVDLYHDQDPFCNHSQMRISIFNDVYTFNLQNPLDVLKLAMIKAYPFTAKTSDSSLPDAKWVIVNEQIEREQAVSKYTKEKEIWKYFAEGKHKLSPDTMRSIAYCFNDPINFNITPNTPIEVIETKLQEKAKDNKTVVNGMTNQARFLMLVGLKPDEIKIRAMIGKAISLGIIRNRSERFMYNGNEIAIGLENTIKHLLNPENAVLFTAIEQEIKVRESV